MSSKNDGRIGRMPAGINEVNPNPDPNAQTIVAVEKNKNKVTGYKLSGGNLVSKEEAVSLAKQGGIKGVGVATNKGTEYLRTLPDGAEENNLSALPLI